MERREWGEQRNIGRRDEEDEGEHSPLTTSPWGTQESGARGLRGDARDGGSNVGKGISETADRGWTWGRHGARNEQGGKREAAKIGKVQNPGEWGETMGAVRPPE